MWSSHIFCVAMLDVQMKSLWNLYEALDGHLVSYMVMTCVCKPKVDDAVMLVDPWTNVDNVLVEPFYRTTMVMTLQS